MASLEINRQFHRLFSTNNESSNVFAEDWDNLIILDGCRYDVLSETDFVKKADDFTSRISSGSNSVEFLESNVNGNYLDDVVWVSANPYVSDHRESIFKVIDAWDEGWNDKCRTVLPETMVEYAKESAVEFPDKRLVVHFMQPHYPFIGPTAQELPQHRTFTGEGQTNDDPKDIWKHLQNGAVDRSLVWKAYTESLQKTLPYVDDLVEELRGRTVITADHGNAFGERGSPIPISIYGHPPGLRNNALVRVPWVVFSSKDRKNIVPDVIESNSSEISSDIKDRLRDLGYVE
ncbi:sulfatase-like hydrolase/transferase [Natrinema salaciae]|nr:sulfatase-like hydrolase/transferase [Natrinema salaciae]